MGKIPHGDYQIQLIGDIANADDDNIDVSVEYNTGERYVATFFTLKNIQTLLTRYKETGECNSGQYLWASDMIIVEELSEPVIGETVASLIEDGEFTRVFSGPYRD